MEEDIQNYSPTVMFRGTPCINLVKQRYVLIRVCFEPNNQMVKCDPRKGKKNKITNVISFIIKLFYF